MIKFNFKKKKNILDIFYSFKANNANNQQNDPSGDDKSSRAKQRYFDDAMIVEKDDRTLFSKEIIEVVLSDLNVDKIEKEKLDSLFENVHDVLNRFQTISYMKGYKAA